MVFITILNHAVRHRILPQAGSSVVLGGYSGYREKMQEDLCSGKLRVGALLKADRMREKDSRYHPFRNYLMKTSSGEKKDNATLIHPGYCSGKRYLKKTLGKKSLPEKEGIFYFPSEKIPAPTTRSSPAACEYPNLSLTR